MNRSAAIRVSVALAVGIALAALVPTVAGVALQSPPQSPPTPMVNLHEEAKLVGEGAALLIGVDFVCGPVAPRTFGLLTLEVGQPSGVGSPITETRVVCDGRQREVTVRVPTESGKFQPGETNVLAILVICVRGQVCQAVAGQFKSITAV
jgi:hypothetical protein